jgi:tRNA(Ile)-lysidine synthase
LTATGPRRVAIAYSGGRDSTALLYATARVASSLGVEVLALHVHHGLVASADAWLEHAQGQCRRWAHGGLPVRLAWRRLSGRPGRGESVEAWARAARYQALHEMARDEGASLLLLAQHRRDQAETWLLQALRGGGPSGLAAMPRRAERAGLVWARPWLDQPRGAIEAYARRYRLAWIDDESNADPRFARNRLRALVWPALLEAFPDAETALATSARQAQAARQCLEETALADLALVGDREALLIARWQALPSGRRANVLAAWLRQASGRPPTAALVERLLAELPRPGSARWSLGDRELRRYRGRLTVAATSPRRSAPVRVGREKDLPPATGRRIALPGWGGVLRLQLARSEGIAPDRLTHLSLHARSGGERFQQTVDGVAQSLKKQYQAGAVPEWQRRGPLLYDGSQLVFVPGLGVDARARAPVGKRQLRLTWEPND